MSKRGFTLAEALITMSIIGIIAALTIPALLSAVGLQTTKTQLLKVMSDLDQALELYENPISSFSEGDTLLTAGDMETALSDDDHLVSAFTSVMDYSNAGLDSAGQGQDAIEINDYTTGVADTSATLIDDATDDIPYITLKNGSQVFVQGTNGTFTNGVIDTPGGCTGYDAGQEICSLLLVDLNGQGKSPNKLGVDLYYFIVTHKGSAFSVIPLGTSVNSDFYPPDNSATCSDQYPYGCAAEKIYAIE